MVSANHVVLLGNLVAEPELRNLPNGTPVTEFRLAVSDSYKNKAGEEVDDTLFIDIVVWSKLAELCSQYLKKGSLAYLEGRLKLDTWKNKEGQNVSKHRIVANRVQFLNKPASNGKPEKADNKDTDFQSHCTADVLEGTPF